MNEHEKQVCIAIGKAIRELRIEYTQKSCLLFAYENDIPKSTLWRIENGENEAKILTLMKIADGFGWSLSELFLRIEKRFPENIHIFEDEHY